MAESFEKPLYQVTCGEIGTHASILEERMEEIFDDAIRFNAILVLDEADVFLQERDYENLERNALVSSELPVQTFCSFLVLADQSCSLPPGSRIFQRRPLSHHQSRWYFRSSIPIPYPHYPRAPNLGPTPPHRSLDAFPRRACQVAAA